MTLESEIWTASVEKSRPGWGRKFSNTNKLKHGLGRVVHTCDVAKVEAIAVNQIHLYSQVSSMKASGERHATDEELRTKPACNYG